MTPRLLNLAEVSAMVGLSRSCLRVHAARGTLRAQRVGRDWLVDVAEVERFRAWHAAQRFGRPRKVRGNLV